MFLREVDDALREDQLATALRNYGKPVGAAIVAGLLALAGFLWWQNHRDSVAGTHGEQFTQGLDQVEAGRLETAGKTLEPLAKDGGESYAAATRMMQAAIALEQKKPDVAAKGFAAVAADGSVPQPYRDLATIREIATRFDQLPPDQVIARLKPMAQPGNPWFGSAGEMVGVAYMKQGRNDLAGPLFGSIVKDKGVPESIRRRVQQLAGLLGVDSIEDPNKVVGVAPAAAAAAPAAGGQ